MTIEGEEAKRSLEGTRAISGLIDGERRRLFDSTGLRQSYGDFLERVRPTKGNFEKSQVKGKEITKKFYF